MWSLDNYQWLNPQHEIKEIGWRLGVKLLLYPSKEYQRPIFFPNSEHRLIQPVVSRTDNVLRKIYLISRENLLLTTHFRGTY